MAENGYKFYGKQAIIFSKGSIVKDTLELTRTELFKEVLIKYMSDLRKKNSPLLDIFPKGLSDEKQERDIISLLQILTKTKKKDVIKRHSYYEIYFKDTYLLNQFVENLYNFWRSYERFFVCYSDQEIKHHKKPYTTFNETVESLNHLVRRAYREICENIVNDHPRIYRQIPAGCQVGLIAVKEEWEKLPKPYDKLKEIQFIKQVLIEPPLLIDPPKNTRTGQFTRIHSNPLEGANLNPEDWLCYPAIVGNLTIYVFIHNKFIGLGTALANLFELAKDEDLKKKPDAIYVYGMPDEHMKKFGSLPTVFYDDEKNGLLVGAVPNDDNYGYFGYLKKMILTLHNIIMMKKGRMPVHGAMVKISMKNGKSANIIIVGDTGAGKSESLEAFRILGQDYLRDMNIIFDDMGSLELNESGEIKAYGTEIGAFVRLDDLQPGFAFGNMDRSIIMSPQKKNARVVIPITTLKEVQHGYNIDYFLYANNFETIDQKHPVLQEFKSDKEAIEVFREGKSMSKGTTSSTGMTTAYFANIFGPAQYKELHDTLAKKYFKAMFDSGIRLAQLRTMLAIPGYENKGPENAAKMLFEEIMKK